MSKRSIRARAPEKRERIKDRLRKRDEFAASAAAPARAPRRDRAVFSWSLEMIRKARDAQMMGKFATPVALARAMRTDDALFTAYHNRIAPQNAIEAKLTAKPGDRGERAKARAAISCIAPRDVIAGLTGTLANHGIAIGYVQQEVNDEGTRVDFKLTEWPLEFVEWDVSRECLTTRVKDAPYRVPIVHGDGRWIVFRKFSVDPWTQEACVIPGAILWFAHMSGVRDWAAASTSHGQAKIIGELPGGITLRDEHGNLTPEAQKMLDMLQDIVSGDSGAAVQPAGAKTTFLSNGSTAWQVFKELVLDRKKASAYIYLGTDATLGAQGGAPGVDISALFGVATTKIQGDFAALEEGLRTGLYEPWAAMNYGDSAYAPMIVFAMPDIDAETQVQQLDKRRTAFFAALAKYKENGMVVNQIVIDKLALEYRIDPPQLMPTAAASVAIAVTPSTNEKIFSIDELRQSQGGQPTGTPRGAMTIMQAEESDKAAAAAKQAAAEAAAAATQPPAPAPAPRKRTRARKADASVHA